MQAKVEIELAPEMNIFNGKRHFINIKMIFNGKVYQNQEIVEENILKSHFDYLFDKLKLSIKDFLEHENPELLKGL